MSLAPVAPDGGLRKLVIDPLASRATHDSANAIRCYVSGVVSVVEGGRSHQDASRPSRNP
jgi:hypothetical protein